LAVKTRAAVTRAARLLEMEQYQTLDAQLDRLEVDWEATKKGT
jgi:hypothetical protein